MSELKDAPFESKGEEVSKLFRVAMKRKLLAATTGNVITIQLGTNFNDNTRKYLMFVIEKIIGCPPANIIPVQKNPWAVVEMEKKEKWRRKRKRKSCRSKK